MKFRTAASAWRAVVMMSPFLFGVPARGAEPKVEAIATPAGGARLNWVGVSSCSAQPCHGDVARDNVWPIWGNEVTLWIERDPHAQAHRVLSNELSTKMAQRLRLGEPANRSQRCLSCHSPNDAGASPPAEPALADGVGCEACHGGASRWLGQHTLDGWRKKTVQAKREAGMLDAGNLHIRAQTCAACHVGAGAKSGSPGGDVDHDLIAAGHPALRFEFTAYLAKMPKHWSEKSSDAGFEARAWAVGQATSAAAALNLLAARAAQDNERPWPEFAEYNCYSCHHQLYGSSKASPRWSRRQQAYDRERPAPEAIGLPSWGTWYLPLTSVLPGGETGAAKAVAEIEQLMRHPGGDRKKLSRAASQAARLFDAWGQRLTAEKYSRAAIDKLLRRMKQAAPRGTSADWDAEAQLYLALVALHYAKHDSPRGPPGDDPLTRSLRQTREELMFPTSIEAGEPRRFDSPRDLDPMAALRERLLPEIERLLNE